MEEKDTPTIYSVAEAGKGYTQKLVKWVMALYYLTPLTHPDQKYLFIIVEGENTLLPY